MTEENKLKVTLKVTDAVTFVVGKLTKDLYAEFKKTLGYKDPNSIWRGKNARNWDGYITTVCYNKTHCRCSIKKDGVHFPTGLYARAIEFFKAYGVEVSTSDERVNFKTQILDIEANPIYPTRDYQQEIVDRAIKQQRGIIKLATGGGKTRVGAAIISTLGVSPFIFYVTSQDLLQQAKDEFEKFIIQNGLPVNVGVIGGGKCDIKDINIMTVQTAIRAVGAKYKKYDDEDSSELGNALNDTKYQQISKLIHDAKAYIADECITGDAEVYIKNNGKQKMHDLHKFVGQEILSFDGTSPVWNEIVHFYDQGIKETILVKIETGQQIKCTKNHPIMTSRGWVQAGDLNTSDQVLCIAGFDCDEIVTNFARISGIDLSSEERVFDITVKNNHCFFANNTLVHNCQHWAAETCQIIADHSINARYRWGLSATPWRDLGDDMLIDACFGKAVADINASYLIKKNILVKPKIYFVHTRKKFDDDRITYAEAYKQGIVQNSERNELISKIAQNMASQGRNVLILVKTIEHGNLLEGMIANSVFVNGSNSDKERAKHINEMRNKKISVTIATSIFDEGVDVKPLDGLILAGSGKSQTRALQRIGRVIRSYEDKETGFVKKDAFIVDFHDNMKYMLSHSKARRKIYETESEFVIGDFHIDE